MLKKVLSLSLALALGVASAAPQLGRQLPADTLFYGHLPSQWQLLMLQSDRDPAPLQEQFQRLRQQLLSLDSLPSLEKLQLPPALLPLLRNFAAQNNGPLELLIRENRDGLYLGLTLEHKDPKRFAALLDDFAAVIKSKREGDDLKGELKVNTDRTCYQFNPDSGAVLLDFNCQGEWQPAAELPLAQAATRVDDKELLLWWSNRDNRLFQSRNDRNAELDKFMGRFGAAQLRYSQDKELTLSLLNANPDSSPRWPQVSLLADFPVTEQLEMAVGFRLPTADQWQQLAPEFYGQLSQSLEKSGIAPADWSAATAGDWALISDRNGVFLLQPAANTAALDRLLDQLVAKNYLSRESLGGGLQHLHIQWGRFLPADQALALNLMFPSHLYYRDGDGHRLWADLPQILQEREQLEFTKKLGDYFGGEPALLVASLQLPQLARDSYYLRLKWLRLWSDLGTQPAALAELPTAATLKLPERSPLRARLQRDENGGSYHLSLKLPNGITDTLALYRSNAFMTGMAAAIVLPAYQQYVEKSKAKAAALQAQSAEK